MNERIRELFKRAGGKTFERNLTSNPVQIVETHQLWDDRVEKFAELIVRECVRLCNQERENYLLVGNEYCDDKAEGLEEAAELIRKHFGVEK